MIWDKTGQILFDLSVILFLANILPIVWFIHKRYLPWLLLPVFGMITLLIGAGLGWYYNGHCILPYPKMIDYTPDMSLCPGQGTTIIYRDLRLHNI